MTIHHASAIFEANCIAKYSVNTSIMSTTTTTTTTLTLAGDFDAWMANLIKIREKTVSIHSHPFYPNADTTQAAAREEMLAASALAASASLEKLTPPPTPIQEASIETSIPNLPRLGKPIPPRPDLNFKSPYFEIRASGKLNGGMGAFATRDIPVMTTILRENYLVEATDRPGHLLEELEKCTEEEKNAFFKLTSYDRLSQNWAQAIFLTNR